MGWAAFTAIATKSASFGSQLALGWILAEDDFALYALAISVASLVAVLKDGGTQKLLIQRGDQYNQLARPILTLSCVFNGAAALFLALTATQFAALYDSPSLPPLIWIIALSLLLACPAMILKSKLVIDLKFAQIAKVTTLSVYFRHGLMVVLAVLGFGPLSFVLPLPAVALLESVVYYLLARKSTDFQPAPNKLTKELFIDLFRASRWIMAGTLASAFINQGDYLIIGRLQPHLLGMYFFGFQISVAFTAIFTTGMRSVLMPTMAKIADDTSRLGHGLIKSIRLVSWVFVPTCFAVILAVPPLIDFLWSGKWNDSIPVAQIMLASLSFRLLTPVAQATMEAKGKWREQAFLLLIDGVGTVVAAVVGSLLGGLIAVTAAVAINRALMALIQCIWAGRHTSTSARAVLQASVVPVAIAGSAAGLALVATVLVVRSSEITALWGAIWFCLYGSFFLGWVLLTKQTPYIELLSRLQKRLSS